VCTARDGVSVYRVFSGDGVSCYEYNFSQRYPAADEGEGMEASEMTSSNTRPDSSNSARASTKTCDVLLDGGSLVCRLVRELTASSCWR